jgi:hypothetical protein
VANRQNLMVFDMLFAAGEILNFRSRQKLLIISYLQNILARIFLGNTFALAKYGFIFALGK